jgi:hypothetical protein
MNWDTGKEEFLKPFAGYADWKKETVYTGLMEYAMERPYIRKICWPVIRMTHSYKMP